MSLTAFIKRFKGRFSFNFLLILLEGGLNLLFPLFIGFAIDDALSSEYAGAMGLAVLGIIALIIGVGRRIFDSRFYAKIYREFGAKLISNQEQQDTSKKSARLGMMKEWIEFLEFSFPELIHAIISLVGVIAIIATLHLDIFWGIIITSMLIVIVYWISSAKTILINKEANDEWEKQVEIISKNNAKELNNHFKKIMRWNVKLSDLEALNFSLSWLFLLAFLVVAIVFAVEGGLEKYGVLFSLVMYVFQYMENMLNLPLFYQNWLRLREITDRLFIS